MDVLTAIQSLEKEWDTVQEIGFFGELESRSFNAAKFKRVQDILKSIEVPEGENLDKRFVEVVWFMPTFMRWQQDGWRIDGKDTKQLDEAISYVEQRLTTILGLP
ncbi:MAG: hypothetical protein GC179_00850 [Anaerolineaceae bacterium]|nr:hypothetical protein [Anaerolineaceae bacterium]